MLLQSSAQSSTNLSVHIWRHSFVVDRYTLIPPSSAARQIHPTLISPRFPNAASYRLFPFTFHLFPLIIPEKCPIRLSITILLTIPHRPPTSLFLISWYATYIT